jgi:DNA-binding PadR family transcriptional regulator
MEMFLMAAISRGGLNTLYALQQSADLQPGSLRQVIKHLVEAGLLFRSDGAKRGRRAMTLTEEGERFLRKDWRNCLDTHREMESILRSVTVAFLMEDFREAFSFLHQSASERERWQSPQGTEPASPKSTPIDLHARMRAIYESLRRKMEAEVLKHYIQDLEEVYKMRDMN